MQGKQPGPPPNKQNELESDLIALALEGLYRKAVSHRNHLSDRRAAGDYFLLDRLPRTCWGE